VQDNLTAVRRGYSEVLEIPRAIIEQEEKVAVETNGRLVRDVMHSGVIACHADTPLPKLVKAMADQADRRGCGCGCTI
jgi:predicted transcriptional regulator